MKQYARFALSLIAVWDTATSKGCGFSAVGIAGTTLGIKVVGGDDAQTMALLQGAETQEVQFSGVGSGAQHPQQHRVHRA
jgi:hypothetical protein